MNNFSNTNISIAKLEDASIIVSLLNQAYRGTESKKGWTTEADLINGTVRSTIEQVTAVLQKEGSVFLLYQNDNTAIACVNLQKHKDRIYLGMFAVEPSLQGGGVGKALLHAAEEWAVQQSCNYIYMTVINIRKELIAWYCRHGYMVTEKVTAFIEDGISGTHNQALFFVELEKLVS